MMRKLPKEIKEGCVNWVDVDDIVSVTAYERKMIRQIYEIHEKHPDEVTIVAVNDDGTVCAHMPKKYVHVSIGERAKREMTEEQRLAAGERLKKAREKRMQFNGNER